MSKSISRKFFFRSATELAEDRDRLVMYLNSQVLMTENRKLFYLKVYDFFCENPGKYNGATAVKDMHHIRGLDINSMIHDYFYEVLKVASNFYYKYWGDMIYGKEMERTGRAYVSWIRFIGVIIGGVYFMPKSILLRGFMSNLDKQQMNFIIKAFR